MNVLDKLRETVIDAWSSLSHKAPLAHNGKPVNGYTATTWVGDQHLRRIAAYRVLAAYDSNTARMFLDTDDEADINERREYGDAALVIDTVLSALLGEEQEIVVDGAEDYDPDLPEPEAIEVTEVDPDTGEEVTVRQEPDEDEVAEWQANEAARLLVERQEFLREWADLVHLDLRLADETRNEITYGDGVWLLGWDHERARPVPAVMDPGFYFPVLPDTLDSYEYPERVHFAWELPPEDFDDNKTRVRRVTYEVRDLFPVYELGPDQKPITGEDDLPVEVLPVGAYYLADPADPGYEQLVRDYPWNDEPTTRACYVTDATWILDDLNDASNVDAFEVSEAETVARDAEGNRLDRLDVGIDFLPVIHIPNTPAGGQHYGQSSLARVAQLLDDLAGADTDTQGASATTGFPITWSNGPAQSNPLTGQQDTNRRDVRPGVHWHLGTEGQAGVIDTSSGLQATREYVIQLRERLLVNSRLPAAAVGTLKPSEVPSGIALQLSFGPLSAMIRQMRLVRAVKYPLLLKMVQRFYMLNDLLDGEIPRAELRLGSFLPSDTDAILKRVREAYAAGLISLETAVASLLDAGFTIDDVAAEVQRIRERDYESANALADATGDNNAVRELLGLEPVEERDRPTVVLPDPTQPPAEPEVE